MKKLLFTLFVTIIALQLSAQENLLTKGDKVLNLGLGLGSTGWGTGYSTSMIPLSASLEVGVVDGVLDVGSIGVGGFIGYASYKYEWYTWQYKYTDLVIAARGSLHYPLVEKLDTYTGLSLGYEAISFSESGDGTPTLGYSTLGSGMFLAWHAGGRYYFSDNFAAMAEIGYGFTWLTIGVALKF